MKFILFFFLKKLVQVITFYYIESLTGVRVEHIVWRRHAWSDSPYVVKRDWF